MDGSTVSDSFNNHKAMEYQQLVGSIADKVAIRVVILVCNRSPLNVSKKDGMKRNEFIAGINRIEKVFVAEVSDGKLAVEKDVLVENRFKFCYLGWAQSYFKFMFPHQIHR
ncbi:uncharacterized protein LOC111341883 [Stylophora pistillata]|uniref:uncharacterized protein LOC111341883 n=1 Tax=Stylophora pistillata TaxID=50429 RepID=UPI000C04DC13|nr:uncharacterized protein LOC111341883 [Stylophora pistillata]